MSVVLYTSDTCQYCHVVTGALARAGLTPGPVRVVNIDREPQLRPYFDATGARALPTAVLDGATVVTGAQQILGALRTRFPGRGL